MSRREQKLHADLTESGKIDPDSVYGSDVVDYVTKRLALEKEWNREV
jgi:hypothetical protein